MRRLLVALPLLLPIGSCNRDWDYFHTGAADGSADGSAGLAGSGGSSAGTGGVVGGSGGDGGAPSGGAPSCTAGQKDCGQGCRDQAPANGCADPSCSPCPTPQNTIAICLEGACSFECASGFDDCNKSPNDGCEQSLSSPESCGVCGRKCAFTHASFASCENRLCVHTCDPYYLDCNAALQPVPDDGCETANTMCPDGTGGTGGTATTACCAAHPTAGCSESWVSSCVCAKDKYCCDTKWDWLCVAEVEDLDCDNC